MIFLTDCKILMHEPCSYLPVLIILLFILTSKSSETKTWLCGSNSGTLRVPGTRLLSFWIRLGAETEQWTVNHGCVALLFSPRFFYNILHREYIKINFGSFIFLMENNLLLVIWGAIWCSDSVLHITFRIFC